MARLENIKKRLNTAGFLYHSLTATARHKPCLVGRVEASKWKLKFCLPLQSRSPALWAGFFTILSPIDTFGGMFSYFISPLPAPDSNPEQISQHLQGMGQSVDLGRGPVQPSDRDLFYFISKPCGNVENLHIKAEAVNSLPCKNLLHSLFFKTLEATLGVFYALNGNGPHK